MTINRLTRASVSILTALSLFLGLAVASTSIAAEASAGTRISNGYVIKPCIVPAVSGPGAQGNGCSVYGVPRVVSYSTAAEATKYRNDLLRFAYRCVASGAVSILFTGGRSAAAWRAAGAACTSAVVVQ